MPSHFATDLTNTIISELKACVIKHFKAESPARLDGFVKLPFANNQLISKPHLESFLPESVNAFAGWLRKHLPKFLLNY
jgi:hypothetical protein